ncbi:MAG: 4Fe-4S binding protein [Sphaerochaeta sp.]
MNYKDFFKIIVEDIHTSTAATVDDEMLPVTCVIDMLDWDEKGLYFLTAKGKKFYDRLIKRKYIALSLLKGEDTMSSLSISVRANVKDIGREKLYSLFEKNKYMYKIYPTEKSREALTVFQIYSGSGELFDLSKKPIRRESFKFGKIKTYRMQYIINDNCIGCGLCVAACPQDCIDESSVPFKINQESCLHCGNCLSECQSDAVEFKNIEI